MGKEKMEEAKKILDLMPYAEPFRFIDEIESVNEEGITGIIRLMKMLNFTKDIFLGFL